MKNMTAETISIQTAYTTAFEYISNPLNQKEWAINFIKDIWETNDGFVANTPLGEMPIKFESDIKTGVIDIYLGNEKKPIPTRLIENGEGCAYIFALQKPTNMPEEMWEKEGIPGLIEELELLKTILEK